jgi:peptide/nickel transport system substrate-binding protein
MTKHTPVSGITRRNFIQSASGLIGALALPSGFAYAADPAETPRSGGTLKIGTSGASTSDTLDPRSFAETFCQVAGYSMMNTLIEIGPDNTLAPELAESWEAKPGATEWIINLRPGITFHNGKTLRAADVIYSINLHRGKTKSGAAGLLRSVTHIDAVSQSQIRIQLSAPDSDFPFILTDYHILIVPDGFEDWTKPIGTGAFEFESFQPGVRFTANRKRDYWKNGRGHVDRIELVAINDSNARVSALLSNQVDVVNAVDPKLVSLLERSSKNVQIIRSKSTSHVNMPMLCDVVPYNNNDFRLALKYAIDRKKILDIVLRGYGRLGNDHPISDGDPDFNFSIEQTSYDPDKARFYLKKSRLDSSDIVLVASDASFNGGVDTALVFQQSAASAGLNLKVQRAPVDGYWNNVWMKTPFCMSNWGGRASAIQMFGTAYQSDAPWNDMHWRRADFDKLLAGSRSTLDPAKRRQLVWAMQEMVHREGGTLIPVFKDRIEAHGTKVKGLVPHIAFDLANSRVSEKAWVVA